MEQEILEQWADELAYEIISKGSQDYNALQEIILRKLKRLANGYD